VAASRKSRRPARSLEKEIDEAKSRVAPLVGDMDPGDLDLILSSLLRPFGTGRRFFPREVRPGVYVF
jgi:hypothetical protein